PNVAGFCWGGSGGGDCRRGLTEMGEKMAEKAGESGGKGRRELLCIAQ
nr:hypothetical protein [Tanacetum cinerariifolium]